MENPNDSPASVKINLFFISVQKRSFPYFKVVTPGSELSSQESLVEAFKSDELRGGPVFTEIEFDIEVANTSRWKMG